MKRVHEPLAAVAEAFHAAAEQCMEDADPRAVHRVRTGSRRLQAMVESMLREAGPSAHAFQGPARDWLRRLKKIRRAAAPVRDLDVQRILLQGWIGKATNSPLQRQAKLLDAWLQDQRRHRAHRMQKQIRKQREGLEERRDALIAAFSGLRLDTAREIRPAEAVALHEFVRAANVMPQLDAENLHDFRKATKKARYVAEAGPGSPTSVAQGLKRIQDAIGAWHDWLCLQQDAREALGQDAPELTAALQREVKRHFGSAIKIGESVRGRLLGEWLTIRRPVSSAAVGNRRTA